MDTSGLSIFNLPVFGRFRIGYPPAQCLRRFPASLSVSPLFTGAPDLPASPLFTGAPSRPIRKRPINKGCRSDRAETPKRRGLQADESLRSAVPSQSDQSSQPRLTAGTRRSGSATTSPQNEQCSSSLSPRTRTWQRGCEKSGRQSSSELKNKLCFTTGVCPRGVSRPRITSATPVAGTKHKDDLFGALMPVIPPAALGKHCRPKRSRRATENPQQRLPRSPRKTGVSGGAARQPSVYAGYRRAYP